MNAYLVENFFHAAQWCDASWRLSRLGDQSASEIEILEYFASALKNSGENLQNFLVRNGEAVVLI